MKKMADVGHNQSSTALKKGLVATDLKDFFAVFSLFLLLLYLFDSCNILQSISSVVGEKIMKIVYNKSQWIDSNTIKDFKSLYRY